MGKQGGIAAVFYMFVSRHHHQLHRYFSANIKNTHPDGYNALNYNWDPDGVLYMNP